MPQQGTVKTWNLTKGFGFIVNEDNEEAFVHTTDIDCGVLVVGGRVQYEARPSPKKPGVILASDITGEGLRTKGDAAPVEKGVVKNWDYGKGSGLITGTDEREIFVHSGVFGGGTLVQGMPVLYEAVDIKHKSGRYAALQVVGSGVKAVGSSRGFVKKWFPDRGFGFVETDDGTEVYVHCSNISDGHLVEGKEVFFNMRKHQETRPTPAQADTALGDRRAERMLATDISGPGVQPGSAPGGGGGGGGGRGGGGGGDDDERPFSHSTRYHSKGDGGSGGGHRGRGRGGGGGVSVGVGRREHQREFERDHDREYEVYGRLPEGRGKQGKKGHQPPQQQQRRYGGGGGGGGGLPRHPLPGGPDRDREPGFRVDAADYANYHAAHAPTLPPSQHQPPPYSGYGVGGGGGGGGEGRGPPPSHYEAYEQPPYVSYGGYGGGRGGG
eukprot:Rhum_TRINITY_DN13309_c1_g1::Rhum_TRINITY_DN13309_c1_g1_i1::g.59102::m.59102